MKKILFFILLLILPSLVKASSVNYTITDYFIDATIEKNGDISMKELIVLDGTFQGYVRELSYKNPKLTSYTAGDIDFSNSAIYNAEGIINVLVSSKTLEEKSKVSFDLFDTNFNKLLYNPIEKNAKEGDFFYKKNKDVLSYKMYTKSEEEQVAFLITYTIEKPVVMHNDVAELYWTFIGTDFTDTINNLKIKIHLPGKETKDTLLFWAHGDITGNINRSDDTTILATMKSLDKNNAIDIRMVFDKSLITEPEELNHSEEEALEKILLIEEKRMQEANEEREMIRAIRNVIIGITFLYYLLLIGLWIYIYFKYDKEHKSDFHAKYYREFTGNYNVEVIDYLVNKNITPNAMSASIMNLIYKKNIIVEEIKENEKKKKYRFLLNNTLDVTNTEQTLIDFLFEEVGKENSFTTTDLEKYAKSTKTCEKFTKNYTSWKNCVKKDAEKEKFYENNGIPIVISIMLLIVTILIFLAVVFYQIDFLFSYFILPFSIIFLFYTIFLKKRTKNGNEDYLRWKAFKNFLNDFSNFKVKELPEIILWEKYLVYATVFGLADKVESVMNVKIREWETMNPNDTYYLNLNPILSMHIYHSINQSVSNSVTSSIAATSARANSSNSTNGFGGGFSGGGGFGGGGGGGHGF